MADQPQPTREEEDAPRERREDEDALRERREDEDAQRYPAHEDPERVIDPDPHAP